MNRFYLNELDICRKELITLNHQMNYISQLQSISNQQKKYYTSKLNSYKVKWSNTVRKNQLKLNKLCEV